MIHDAVIIGFHCVLTIMQISLNDNSRKHSDCLFLVHVSIHGTSMPALCTLLSSTVAMHLGNQEAFITLN